MSNNDRYKHFEEAATSSAIGAVRPLIELLKAKDAEIKRLQEQVIDPHTVHVCPTRDIECGHNYQAWCVACPKWLRSSFKSKE